MRVYTNRHPRFWPQLPDAIWPEQPLCRCLLRGSRVRSQRPLRAPRADDGIEIGGKTFRPPGGSDCRSSWGRREHRQDEQTGLASILHAVRHAFRRDSLHRRPAWPARGCPGGRVPIPRARSTSCPWPACACSAWACPASKALRPTSSRGDSKMVLFPILSGRHSACSAGLTIEGCVIMCSHLSAVRPQRTRVPGGGGTSKPMTMGFPPSGLAASTIPFDSTPISVAG